MVLLLLLLYKERRKTYLSVAGPGFSKGGGVGAKLIINI